MKYNKEDRLELTKQVRITEEAYKILREEKKKQGISMAKIICNLIISKFNN